MPSWGRFSTCQFIIVGQVFNLPVLIPALHVETFPGRSPGSIVVLSDAEPGNHERSRELLGEFPRFALDRDSRLAELLLEVGESGGRHARGPPPLARGMLAGHKRTPTRKDDAQHAQIALPATPSKYTWEQPVCQPACPEQVETRPPGRPAAPCLAPRLPWATLTRRRVRTTWSLAACECSRSAPPVSRILAFELERALEVRGGWSFEERIMPTARNLSMSACCLSLLVMAATGELQDD